MSFCISYIKIKCTISVSQIDACNGITSATPEFPSGIYHYVLPIGVTGKQSSLNCYAGTVSTTQMTAMARSICGRDAALQRWQIASRARRRQIAHWLRDYQRNADGLGRG